MGYLNCAQYIFVLQFLTLKSYYFQKRMVASGRKICSNNLF